MALTFPINFWGGANYRDQPDELVSRSHALGQGGWQQLRAGSKPIGIESPDLLNVDFDKKGLKKRLGQASYQDLSADIPAGDSAVAYREWTRPDGTRMEFLVTTTTIMYSSAGGAWAQINATTGASAFTFASNVTKASVVPCDGHLFFWTDGSTNYPQVYRTGTAIDPQMTSGNGYTDAYGSATSHAITGTWPQGSHVAVAVNSRLAWAEEGVLIQYTPMAHTSSSGVWDLTGSGGGAFHASTGEIRFMQSFIPRGANQATDEQLMIGTSGGIESTTGFQAYDRLNIEEGAEGVLNHKAVATAGNWIIYPTINGNINGYNGAQVVDLGARLRSPNDDGPLDDIDIATSETYSCAVYDPEKSQVRIHYCTSTARVNDSVAVIDFQQGEPVHNEPLESFERRVRVLPWQIISPDDNDWFIHIGRKREALIGVMADGTLWTINSGTNDLGDKPISAHWKSPIITGGDPFSTLQKQWIRLSLRADQSGNWDATISHYHDREDDAQKTWAMTLVKTGAPIVGTAVVPFSLTGGGDVRDFDRIDKRSEAFQFQLENTGASEDFLFTQASITYDVGAEVN